MLYGKLATGCPSLCHADSRGVTFGDGTQELIEKNRNENIVLCLKKSFQDNRNYFSVSRKIISIIKEICFIWVEEKILKLCFLYFPDRYFCSEFLFIARLDWKEKREYDRDTRILNWDWICGIMRNVEITWDIMNQCLYLMKTTLEKGESMKEEGK